MKYSHLVEISLETNKLSMYRVFENGGKDFYTEMDLPEISLDQNREDFDAFCENIGQMLLVDSPVARKKFHI